TLGKPAVFGNGSDGVIVTTGSYLDVILNVQKKLQEKGYQLKVINLHTIKPINKKSLLKELLGQKLIITAEEHKLTGGLGTIVNAMVLENISSGIVIKNIGVKNEYPSVIGKQDYLRKYYAIDQESVYKKILTELKNGQ
ncbi:MAG: transketolase C-terminal domain-containing protein, partial [Candidatus Paceibacterales bacterium]